MKRQVFDLSTLNIQVTEYPALIKVCPNCHYKNEGQFPKHVTQPTQYGPHLTSVLSYLSHYQLIPFNRVKQLTQDIFGATIIQETLVNMTKRFYELLETTEASIKESLLSSNYLHLDETGCHVNGKRQWLHVTSNKKFTHYLVHEKCGSKAIEANGILPSFKGTIIHDHWTPYFKYDDCTQALCNVHHLREFKGIIDFEKQQRAKDMTNYYLKLKLIQKRLNLLYHEVRFKNLSSDTKKLLKKAI